MFYNILILWQCKDIYFCFLLSFSSNPLSHTCILLLTTSLLDWIEWIFQNLKQDSRELYMFYLWQIMVCDYAIDLYRQNVVFVYSSYSIDLCNHLYLFLYSFWSKLFSLIQYEVKCLSVYNIYSIVFYILLWVFI